jgi:hypothetical protein
MVDLQGDTSVSDGANNGGEAERPRLFQPFTIRGLTLQYGWRLEKRIRTREGFATPTGAVIRPL